ncbi:dihydroorotase [Halorhodospira abdelmalekii]|uniref:dihydroorotase n=1 Tax=Halorhodospira abdelmalekii TaxID=421629 RepID=UPI0019037695|nr:dihydroorotase [Halorhodospira abdelmalekii]
MSRVHIRGGTIIDPSTAGHGTIEADLYIAAGRIVGIGSPPADFTPDRTIAADGQLVVPGLIDLAARLREPGSVRKGGIVPEARAAAAAGITTLLQPPDTQPVTDTPAVVELIHNRSLEAGGARVHPLGALTRALAGEHLTEMAALRDAGCPGLSDGGQPIRNTLVLSRALDYAATFDIPIVLTPQDPDLAAAGLVHDGAVATRCGLPGQPVATETAAVGRLLALAEERGVAIHIGRLSSARAAQMIAEAQRAGLRVSADTAVHYLHLTEEDCSGYNTTAHVCPPLRSAEDRAGLRHYVASGAIGALCSDHQPHDPDAKACPFAASEPGISGLDTLLALTLRLVDEGVLDLRQAIARLTCGPATALRLNAGTLQIGAVADVTLIDPRQRWHVSPETLHSRGHNTPFLGWELTGIATTTLVAGEVVYQAAAAR